MLAKRLPRTLNLLRRTLSSTNGIWENKTGCPLPTDSTHKCLLEQLSSLPNNTIINRMTGDKVSYPEMADRSLKVGAKLKSCGVHEGDHVMLFSPNHENYISSVIGLMSIGAVPCLANPSYTEYELGALCKSSDIKFIVSGAVNMPISRKISEAQNIPILYVVDEQELWTAGTDPLSDLYDAGLDDLAVIGYSSGTTGLPKGVMLSHHNLNCERVLVNSQGAFDVSRGVPNLNVLPWYHAYGFTQMSVCLDAGIDVWLFNKFDPELFLKSVEESKTDFLAIVPPLIIFMAKHPMVSNFDLSRVEDIVSAAAPLSQELINETMTRFPNLKSIRQGYGMTETAAAITCQGKTCTKTGSVGTLLDHCRMKVVEPGTETILPDGQAGEILLGGPLVMKGYYNNEKATSETLTSDNFVRTGDVGYIDTEGTLFITDRLKELIKVKGFQVAPAELEGVLASHPAIGDAAVIGIPHEKFGEVPKAFITPAPGVTLTVEDVKEIISSRLSAEKALGEVEFMDVIPKLPSGKILRKDLRKLEESRRK